MPLELLHQSQDFTIIHHLLFLAFPFVLYVSLNIPQLQSYQIDMQDEVVYNLPNFVFT